MSATVGAELSSTSVSAAAERIAAWVNRTPLLTSRTLNALVGAEVYCKCEQFQRVGAFKFRGACHALACLTSEQRRHGVVTHSSGNHAQALALAARLHGTSAYIVMPVNAPAVKRNAVAEYGATIIPCEATLAARESTARQVVEETGATFVHPYDDPRVIAGQGTAAREMFLDVPDLEVVIVPIGGGGLISGTSLAATAEGVSAEVWGAEPQGADDAWRSKEAGRWIEQTDPQTIADGLRTSLGRLTWPFVQQRVAKVVTVSDAEIVTAMRWTWERMKLLIEPSSATVMAVLFRPEFREARGKKVGVILSGGNVDLDHLPWQAV